MIHPRHRWFRFAVSLRLLFVILTVVSVWLGWQWRIVQERKYVRAMLRERNLGLDGLPATVTKPVRPTLNWIRVFFGDVSTAQIYLNRKGFSVNEIGRIKSAFPEITVTIVGDSEIGNVDSCPGP